MTEVAAPVAEEAVAAAAALITPDPAKSAWNSPRNGRMKAETYAMPDALLATEAAAAVARLATEEAVELARDALVRARLAVLLLAAVDSSSSSAAALLERAPPAAGAAAALLLEQEVSVPAWMGT